MSTPSIAVFTGGLLLRKDELYSLADSSERLFEDGHLLVPRHVAARELQVFLDESMSGGNAALMEPERTSCFFTGRNSSFVAASSIDGLFTLG